MGDYALLVVGTVLIVLVGVVLVGSALAGQGVGEHARALWQTFFGRDADLPSLPPEKLNQDHTQDE